jgi:hypothetical protein
MAPWSMLWTRMSLETAIYGDLVAGSGAYDNWSLGCRLMDLRYMEPWLHTHGLNSGHMDGYIADPGSSTVEILRISSL